jgi:hypothetical protein
MSEEKNGIVEIFALWEYDSYEDYEKIENKVKSDEEHVNRVQTWFKKMGGRDQLKEVFFKMEEDFLKTNVPLDKTILSTK